MKNVVALNFLDKVQEVSFSSEFFFVVHVTCLETVSFLCNSTKR